MIVFKHFMKAVKKNIFAILIYACIFAGVIFNMAKELDVSTFKKAKTDIIIDDRANDEVSAAVKDFLADNNLQFKKLTDVEKEKAITLKDAALIVTINENAKDLLLSDSGPTLSTYTNNESSSQSAAYDLSQFMGYLKYYDLDAAKAKEMMDVSANVSIEAKGGNEVDLNYMFKFAGFIMIGMLMFNISMVNAELNKIDFYKRSIASPITSGSYNGQMFLGQATIGLVLNIIMLTVIGLLIPETRAHMGISAVNFIVFTLSILGMVNLATAISDKKSVLAGVANVFSMLLATTGGAFVPMEFLPEWMINVGKVFPYYYLGQNAGVADFDKKFIMNLIIMLAMGFVYFLICNLVLKKKRTIE